MRPEIPPPRLWQSRWKQVIDRIRASLIQSELLDDPRHVFSHPSPQIIDAYTEETTRKRSDPFPPAIIAPAHVMKTSLARSIWDLTEALDHHLRRSPSGAGLILSIELDNCIHSRRNADALKSAVALWSPTHRLLRIKVGDRLKKAYFRELHVRDIHLVLGSLPLTMVFHADGARLRYQTLALAPLGPSHSNRKIQNLLSGIPLVAPGSDQESVYIRQGRTSIVLNRDNAFFHPFLLAGA